MQAVDVKGGLLVGAKFLANDISMRVVGCQ